VLYDTTTSALIDFDVTDDPVHGSRHYVFFNRYYDSVCYTFASSVVGIYYRPITPFKSTRQREPLDELKRIIPSSGSTGPRCNLLCGVTAPRTDIMRWCEARGIDYVFGLAVNERLMRMTLPLQQKAQAQYQQRQ